MTSESFHGFNSCDSHLSQNGFAFCPCLGLAYRACSGQVLAVCVLGEGLRWQQQQWHPLPSHRVEPGSAPTLVLCSQENRIVQLAKLMGVEDGPFEKVAAEPTSP